LIRRLTLDTDTIPDTPIRKHRTSRINSLFKRRLKLRTSIHTPQTHNFHLLRTVNQRTHTLLIQRLLSSSLRLLDILIPKRNFLANLVEENSTSSGTSEICLWWDAEVEGLLECTVAVVAVVGDSDAFGPGEAGERLGGDRDAGEAYGREGLVGDGALLLPVLSSQ
jgi:hypothetical protein